ncbi:hypothetical protein ABFA07_018407 [Porites harrisoni]
MTWLLSGSRNTTLKQTESVLTKLLSILRSSPSALALNLLDNLIPKEVQRISNIKGMNGKTPLNPMVLAAIKGQLKRQFKWSDEELEKNWGGKTGPAKNC